MKHALRYSAFVFCAALLASVVFWHAAESASGFGALPVCEIRGTVSDVQIKKSPVPSPLVENETLISVDVQERKARYGDIAPCTGLKSVAENRTYKLCSQNDIETGDIIGGTEAVITGPASPVGCLFDLVVIAHKE
ncbi:MAG: hypothetical protein ACK4PK_04645 [Alphaproteobacteria bacterium]